MTKPPMMRLTVCSLLLLAACRSLPQRPDTDICVNNPQLEHKKCYNLRRDYDEEGQLKPGAVPSFKPLLSLADVEKDISTDPDGWANLKAYIRQLRDELKLAPACARVIPMGIPDLDPIASPSPIPLSP